MATGFVPVELTELAASRTPELKENTLRWGVPPLLSSTR
jgi:hypothetical protein